MGYKVWYVDIPGRGWDIKYAISTNKERKWYIKYAMSTNKERKLAIKYAMSPNKEEGGL
jgi:hypothetical protein